MQRVGQAGAAAVLAREQQVQQQALILGPVVDDTVWAVAPSPLWSGVWRRIQEGRLPRLTRLFAWRLLHGALPCGGATVFYHPPGSEDLMQCLCQAPSCVGASPRPVESLQHLFLVCPASRGSMRWLVGLWGLLDPSAPALPEESWPQVLLADDAGVWQPSDGLRPMWTLLRVTMLQSVWRVRCAQRGQPGQLVFRRVAVLGAFVREVRSLVLRDWARVQGDVRAQAGVPLSWLRGRQPAMELAEFQQVWCAQGVIAVAGVDAGGRRRLELKLSLASVPGQYLEAVPPEDGG